MAMLAVVLLVAGMVLFHRIGEHDYGAGFVVAGLSLIVGLVTWFALDWGRFGYLGGQVLLFVGLTLYNVRRMSAPSR